MRQAHQIVLPRERERVDSRAIKTQARAWIPDLLERQSIRYLESKLHARVNLEAQPARLRVVG